MITLPCRFDISNDEDFFGKDDPKDHESLRKLVTEGFKRARALSKEKFSESYASVSITPPAEYAMLTRKNSEKIELLHTAYEMISSIIGVTPGSFILMHPPKYFADLVIVDNFYLGKNEPIFGRQYSTFIRKVNQAEVPETFTILQTLKAFINPLEELEQKLEQTTHYHSTSKMKADTFKHFVDSKLPDYALPVATDAFHQIGVCELLIVDSVLLGDDSLEDLSTKEFGQNYEVFLHAKH